MVGAGIVTAAATVLGIALKGLGMVVQQTIKAFETARQLYAKSLTSGMGLQWTAKRGLLASIMGVSEQDVFRFGAQMAYLNPKLEQASRILAQTATPLTQVSWQFKVLEADMSALFAQLANDAAPTLLKLGDAMANVVNWTGRWYHALIQLTNLPALGAMLKIGNPITTWLLNKLAGLESKMPSPQAWMKQLVAGAEEHHGLVVGGGGMNYQREISKNTRMMAAGIKELVHLSQRSKYSRNSWGMSGTVNNP
jgi:hypothetical protein